MSLRFMPCNPCCDGGGCVELFEDFCFRFETNELTFVHDSAEADPESDPCDDCDTCCASLSGSYTLSLVPLFFSAFYVVWDEYPHGEGLSCLAATYVEGDNIVSSGGITLEGDPFPAECELLHRLVFRFGAYRAASGELVVTLYIELWYLCTEGASAGYSATRTWLFATAFPELDTLVCEEHFPLTLPLVDSSFTESGGGPGSGDCTMDGPRRMCDLPGITEITLTHVPL